MTAHPLLVPTLYILLRTVFGKLLRLIACLEDVHVGNFLFPSFPINCSFLLRGFQLQGGWALFHTSRKPHEVLRVILDDSPSLQSPQCLLTSPLQPPAASPLRSEAPVHRPSLLVEARPLAPFSLGPGLSPLAPEGHNTR